MRPRVRDNLIIKAVRYKITGFIYYIHHRQPRNCMPILAVTLSRPEHGCMKMRGAERYHSTIRSRGTTRRSQIDRQGECSCKQRLLQIRVDFNMRGAWHSCGLLGISGISMERTLRQLLSRGGVAKSSTQSTLPITNDLLSSASFH
jgi:hypothetical protein